MRVEAGANLQLEPRRGQSNDNYTICDWLESDRSDNAAGYFGRGVKPAVSKLKKNSSRSNKGERQARGDNDKGLRDWVLRLSLWGQVFS
jgi:hypothetical protein